MRMVSHPDCLNLPDTAVKKGGVDMTQIKHRPKTYMKHAYFFGYGSLVNRDTHAFTAAHTARLRGWKRVWRHTDLRPVAFLTVVPDTDSKIDGLIAAVPGDDWAALDERERAYTRVPAAHQVTHALTHQPEIAVYSIPDGAHGAPTETHPALLSYIDVVVQGYLREFGEDGARAFFDTTDGWDTPVLDDRAEPLYPRHRRLSLDEYGFVDDQLARRDIRLIGP